MPSFFIAQPGTREREKKLFKVPVAAHGISPRQNGLRVVVKNDIALIHDGNVMGRVDHRHLSVPVDLSYRIQNIAPRLSIYAYSRFIEIHYLRVVQQTYC